MKKITLTPVAPTVIINVDEAINEAVELWTYLQQNIRLFGADATPTKLIRARWHGARMVIDALGVTDAYLDKCAEADHEK